MNCNETVVPPVGRLTLELMANRIKNWITMVRHPSADTRAMFVMLLMGLSLLVFFVCPLQILGVAIRHSPFALILLWYAVPVFACCLNHYGFSLFTLRTFREIQDVLVVVVVLGSFCLVFLGVGAKIENQFGEHFVSGSYHTESPHYTDDGEIGFSEKEWVAKNRSGSWAMGLCHFLIWVSIFAVPTITSKATRGAILKKEKDWRADWKAAYSRFHDATQSHARSIPYCERAASQGDVEAQLALGKWYSNGVNVRQDDVEAYKWLSLAALEGVTAAINLLETISKRMSPEQITEGQLAPGRHYANGWDVPKNDIEAYKWISLAAAQGNEGAVKLGDHIAMGMSPEQIAEAQRRAGKLWRKWRAATHTL